MPKVGCGESGDRAFEARSHLVEGGAVVEGGTRGRSRSLAGLGVVMRSGWGAVWVFLRWDGGKSVNIFY